jgi:Chaperone of endosialidase
MSYIGNTSTTQAFTPAVDYFSGNASTTAFTLSRPVASVAQVQVVVNNVAQNPSSAYTISSNTITFTSAPSSGTNNIYVYYTSPITQTFAPAQGTVNTTSFASSTGTGAGVFQTSPTITTPVISSLSSASSTALTLQSAGTTAVTIDTSQNVGIGTTSPSLTGATKALTINAPASGNYSAIELASAGAATANFIANSSNVYIGSYTNIPFVFQTNNTERMRIDTSGNLLVNQTSQTGAEKVGISFSRAGGWGLAIKNTSATSPSNATYVSFYYTSTNTGSINSTGTTTTYDSASDYRLKENIAPMTGALAKVTQLKPCTYTWKINGSAGQGFLAHELQEIVSDCVRGNKDDVNEDGSIKPQMIDTSFLVATLTAAIQELKAINDTQAETINALTARVAALENK